MTIAKPEALARAVARSEITEVLQSYANLAVEKADFAAMARLLAKCRGGRKRQESEYGSKDIPELHVRSLSPVAHGLLIFYPRRRKMPPP